MRVKIVVADGGLQNGWSYAESAALDMQIEDISVRISRLTKTLEGLRARRAVLTS